MDDTFEVVDGTSVILRVELSDKNERYPITVRMHPNSSDVAFLTKEETENLVRHLMGVLIKLEARDDPN